MGGSGPGQQVAVRRYAKRSLFDGELTYLRTAFSASATGALQQADISDRVVSLARAAKANGMTPESVVVAVRNAWDQEMVREDQHSTQSSANISDLERHQVIGALLDAYFAEPADR